MGTSAMMVDTSSTALLSLAIFWQSFGKCVPVSMNLVDIITVDGHTRTLQNVLSQRPK